MTRLFRPFAAALGLLLAATSGCANTSPAEGQVGQVQVVDIKGNPIPGAVVLPDPETAIIRPKDEESELVKAGTTNQAGLVSVNLEGFYWSDDNCYHFKVTRRGYEIAILSVSRELFPGHLRVELKTPSQN